MTATDAEVIEGEVITADDELQRAVDQATLDGERPNAELIHVESRTGKGFLTIDPNQTEWTPAQLVALKSIGIETEGDDAIPMSHVLQFLYTCQMRDLDPWLREAYLITHGKRFWSDKDRCWVDKRKYTLVTGIDGFRKRSEDTGHYAGQVGPQWCGEDGIWRDVWLPKWGDHPEAARVGVLRKGNPEPTWGVALYDEFVPMVDEYAGYGRNREKTGRKIPTDMWIKMPANQIAKCAEAQAHRKASPRQMSGLVIPEEMERAQVEYQAEQAEETRRALSATRQAAFASSQAQPTTDARAGEPVPAGQAVRETVEQMRAGTRAPRGATRAPASAVGRAATAPTDEERLNWARAEAQFLAELFGKTMEEFLARQSAALDGKAPGDFTAAELLSSILPLRAPAVERLRKVGRGDEAAAYETVPSGALMPLDLLLGRTVAGAVDPAEPHEYANHGGVCQHCEREQGESIHQG